MPVVGRGMVGAAEVPDLDLDDRLDRLDLDLGLRGGRWIDVRER